MTPLIVLAWMATTAERVAALDLGADDFLTMPIVPAELFARMHAAVRRSQGHARSVLRVGAVEVDIAMSEVRVLGARMQVSRREFNVLELLWMRRGEVVTLNSILDHLYAGLDAPEIKGTQVIICRLRKRLRAAGAPRLIDTVWGRGYIVREPYLTPVELTPA
jgi:two-component system cell cycle response regulator CtrA